MVWAPQRASQKLKACAAIERHFAGRGEPIPAKFRQQVAFKSRNEAAIKTARDTFFSGKHPRRWTGCTLSVDARAAQSVTPTEGLFAWPVDLDAFYATRYPHICWNVHGSGAAGVRFVSGEQLPFLGAEGMLESLNFAVRCAMLVVAEFGLFGAETKRAFSRCQVRRTAILKQLLPDVVVT